MRETPFFFESSNNQLFGVLHSPNEQGSLIERKYGIVFCTPFAEEKMFSHRVYVNMARALAREGVACLRFDFMGEGDSEGSFENSSITSRLSDISTALSTLKEKDDIEHIGLLGVRFGATLAALAASQFNVYSLILISPILFGESYMDLCLRSNLTTQMVAYKKVIKDRTQLISELLDGIPVNIDGYLVGRSLYKQMIDINMLNIKEILAKKIHVITISKNNKQPNNQDLVRFIDQFKQINNTTECINIIEDAFWNDVKIYSPVKTALNSALIEWLSKIMITSGAE